MTALTLSESQQLTRLEAIISDSLKTFVEVGSALLEIKQRKLYRTSAKTWEIYVREKWQFSGRWADKLLVDASVVITAESIAPGLVTTQQQARNVNARATELAADGAP